MKKTMFLFALCLNLNIIVAKDAKIICIKKGLIGMPNISTPDYLGKFIDKNGDTCYVFAKK